MTHYIGIDWAAQTHAVCVIDAGGACEASFSVTHNAAGLSELQAQLLRLVPERNAGIAIERANGVLVDSLIEAGWRIVPIHPRVVKAARPRYRSHGGKSDASDAYLLADLLRTDGHRFAPLRAPSDTLRALRALVRQRDTLVSTRTALTNQLRSLLDSFWPAASNLFAELDSPIALAFVQRYPSPQRASRLGPRRMAAFLRKQHYSGRRSASELLERLHGAAAGHAGVLESNAKGLAAAALAALLVQLLKQLTELNRCIDKLMHDSPDGPIFMSFPRAGCLCAAQILAEIGDIRERFPTDAQLAAEAGVVPVTFSSGKSRGVGFRWACNHRLRRAITCLADNSRHASPWAATVYSAARARGCDHPHAVRILARAWLRVIWRAWIDRIPYDPARHGAATRLQSMPG